MDSKVVKWSINCWLHDLNIQSFTEPGKSLNLKLKMSRPGWYWKRLWPWKTPE